MNAYCTCPAGENGQYCKHRFAILAGDGEAVVSGNEDQVKTVKAWLPGTDLDAALIDLAQAEHEFDEAKERLTAAKTRVAAAMRK